MQLPAMDPTPALDYTGALCSQEPMPAVSHWQLHAWLLSLCTAAAAGGHM